MKQVIISILVGILFFSYKQDVRAWTEWYPPTRFAGMTYDSPNNWSDVTNVATWDDNAWAVINNQFGNPAPEKWLQSFGFTMPQETAKKVTEIEVQVRMRRQYSVSPNEVVEAWIVNPDGDISSALNATAGTFSFNLNGTSFSNYTFAWRDGAEPYTRVSDYLESFDDSDFTLVIGVSKNGTSGSTNFVHISQVKLRFETDDNWLSDMLPADVTQVDIAVEQLRDTLDSRAPFAYFNAVTGLDFSDVEQATFSMYLPVPYPNGTVNYPIVIPDRMNDILYWVRWATGISIIGLVILYIMRLSDRTI